MTTLTQSAALLGEVLPLNEGSSESLISPPEALVLPVPVAANAIMSLLPETTVPQPAPLNINSPKTSILGTSGDDDMTGTAVRDWMLGLDGADIIRSLGGNDGVFGGNGNDILDGGAGRDLMYGDDGNDLIWGGAGGDDINGGAGDDLIDGGRGADVMFGSYGGDAFVFGNGDVVTDFSLSEGDTILFAASLNANASRIIQIQTQTGLELGLEGSAARMLLEGFYGTLDVNSDIGYNYVPVFDFL